MRPNTVFKPSKRRPKAAPATPPPDHRAVLAWRALVLREAAR